MDNSLKQNTSKEEKVSLSFLLVCGISMMAGIFLINLATGLVKQNLNILWIILGLFIIKIFLVDKKEYSDVKGFLISKIIDVLLVSAGFYFNNNDGTITFLLIVLTLQSSLAFGRYAVKLVLVLNSIIYAEYFILMFIISSFSTNTVIILTASLIINIIFGMTSIQYIKVRSVEREELEKNLEESAKSNQELTNSNTDMKLRVIELENKIQKTSKTLAELSTLQQVSTAINSTINMKELFQIINDIIIGLFGVTYSTIYLKTDDEKRLALQISNIKNERQLETLYEKMALKILDLIEEGRKVVDTNIDPYTYPDALTRGVKSANYITITKKNKILGLIIAEYTVEKGMDEETKKFIETIANQLGIAIENAMLYEEMERLATEDELTRVYNRSYFQKLYEKEFTEGAGKPISIMFMDVDHLDILNENYGYDFGDDVLKTIAQIAKSTLKERGIIARYGGPKFVIMVKQSMDDSVNIAEEIRAAIENSYVKHNGKGVKVTVSIGVSEYPTTSKDALEVLKKADETLAKVKEEGRNKVEKSS